jgi:hypothetical protein
VDRSWEYINRSQAHECRNWDKGRAISFLGIHKWDFRCSVRGCVVTSVGKKNIQLGCEEFIYEYAVFSGGSAVLSYNSNFIKAVTQVIPAYLAFIVGISEAARQPICII